MDIKKEKVQGYDERYLPATDNYDEKHILTKEEKNSLAVDYTKWHLTKSQYAVYYWLMAHCCWTSPQKHYYIYDNKWTYKKVAEECGISVKTVQRAVAEMEKRKIIERDPDQRKAYLIYWPEDKCAAINQEMIKYFIGMHDFTDLPLSMKLYTLLVYGYNRNVNDRQFTIADLERALRLRTGREERIHILSLLGLWHMMDLVTLEKEVKREDERRPYLIYTIKRIETDLSRLPNYLSNSISDVKGVWEKIVAEQKMLDDGENN